MRPRQSRTLRSPFLPPRPFLPSYFLLRPSPPFPPSLRPSWQPVDVLLGPGIAKLVDEGTQLVLLAERREVVEGEQMVVDHRWSGRWISGATPRPLGGKYTR